MMRIKFIIDAEVRYIYFAGWLIAEASVAKMRRPLRGFTEIIISQYGDLFRCHVAAGASKLARRIGREQIFARRFADASVCTC